MTRLEWQAAQVALGVAGPVARDLAEALAACDTEFATLLAGWQAKLSGLAELAPEAAPPPHLFEAVTARIAAEAAEGRATVTVVAAEGRWRPLAPGVLAKTLHQDRDAGRHSTLIRLAPGAVLAAHPHAVDEECLVLEGSIETAGAVLHAGDYQLVPAGVPHGAIRSDGGALIFVSGGA